jgi:hypothetical protein
MKIYSILILCLLFSLANSNTVSSQTFNEEKEAAEKAMPWHNLILR